MKRSKTTTIVSNVIRGVPTRLGSSRLVLPAAALLVLATAGQAWGQPSEVAKLLAPDAAALDTFGTSVSISGGTAIVGAPHNDDACENDPLCDSGSAYIFQQGFDGQPWGWVATLTALDASEQDRFGDSVSISGDIAIVGSPFDDAACPADPNCNSGSAYIFYRNFPGNNDWGQVAKLTASDGGPLDRFGMSVSISGDFAIVGAFVGVSAQGGNVGAAYVFVKPPGGWMNMTQTAKLTASDGAVDDFFGISVSISGDTAIVGAHGDDGTGDLSGSAYIFVKPSSGWVNMTETVKLTASNGGMFDLFGVSVAISRDTAIVGAYGENGFAGAAYVFVEPPDGWDSVPSPLHETAKLTASDPFAEDNFGFRVSIRGDGATVGAQFHDDNGFNSGSAYVFLKPTSGWQNTNQEDHKLIPSDAAPFDEFGNAVSISGDIAVIGAHLNSDNGGGSGSAYIFEGVCPCPWDLDGSGAVGILDLLELLKNWGPCPGPPQECPWDFDGNGDVDILDLLTLLANWSTCPCVEAPPSRSLDDELADAGLSQADWEAFKECMNTGTQAEQDNCLCWMQNYLDGCDGGTRQACSDHDPFTDCVGDLNGDCCVDRLDADILLNKMGPCPAGPGACLGDLNGDCVVDKSDHRDLLSHFGACPGTQYCPTAPPGCGTTTTTQLEGAVTQMGFSGVADYQGHISATSEGEAFVCACVLQVLLEAQP